MMIFVVADKQTNKNVRERVISVPHTHTHKNNISVNHLYAQNKNTKRNVIERMRFTYNIIDFIEFK